MQENNDMCYLLPYVTEDIFTMQTNTQQIGWHISSYNIPDLWKITQGEGVTVAIIDSGCDLEHVDLKSSLISGKNFVEENLSPEDASNHGTHVAGIIAANNNDYGIVGVAPNSKIMPLKVLNSFGMGSLDHVEKAIYYAVDNGADIITMSLGTRNPVEKIQKAMQYANDKKVVCFVAAGNAGSSRSLLYPAAYTECISIGAVDENSMRADFSCTGPNLDFVAPGVKIYSTVPKNSYAFLSGTSMSCPFVVGTAALVLSERRQYDKNAKIGIEEYREILKSNSLSIKNLDQNLDQQGKRFWQGMGIINPNEFEEWTKYRTIEEVKRELIVINDKLSLVKDKNLLNSIKPQFDLIASKILTN
jgi:major intracellular serine protease